MPTNYANIKSTRPTKTGFNRPYFLIDASKKPIGRIATESAKVLMGKNRADYSPDVDMGGIVVIINAGQQVLTGKKAERKVYFRYGRRLGSLKSRSYEEAKALDFKFPIYNAIKKMLPKNRHQDLRANNRLIIVEDGNHGLTFPMTELDFDSKNLYSAHANVVINKPKAPKAVKEVVAEAKVDSKPKAIKSDVESTPVKAPKAAVEGSKDDLKKIEGIGPKIEEHLNNAGIVTFADLASSSIETLEKILEEAGPRYSIHKPTTWADQSAMARDGKWDELKTWQDELNGGKEESSN
jgi:ribosomal protein L13